MAALALAVAVAAAGVYLIVSGGGGRRVVRPRIEIALADDPVFVRQDYYNRELAFAQARRLGVTWLRVVVPWHTVAGHAGYDWTVYDGLVRAARRHGVKIEMTLAGPAPAWATADGNPTHFDLSAYLKATEKVTKSETEWRSILTPASFDVLREAGTRSDRFAAPLPPDASKRRQTRASV